MIRVIRGRSSNWYYSFFESWPEHEMVDVEGGGGVW